LTDRAATVPAVRTGGSFTRTTPMLTCRSVYESVWPSQAVVVNALRIPLAFAEPSYTRDSPELKVVTPAGPVAYRAAADVQVFDKAGKPWGTVARLAAGLRVRVYYLVLEDGPRVAEVDLAD